MATVKTVQVSNGTSAGSVTSLEGTAEAKSADYAITDTDGIRTILMTTGGTNRTVTLPTAADNASRIITVKKVDSGTGLCTVDGEGAELIYGGAATNTTFPLYYRYDTVTLQCDGTGWHILDVKQNTSWETFTPASDPATFSSSSKSAKFRRIGDSIECSVFWTLSSAVSGTISFTAANVLPTGLTMATPLTVESVGTWEADDSSAATTADNFCGTVQFTTGALSLIIGPDAADATDPFTWASGDTLAVNFRIPVNQWTHFG